MAADEILGISGQMDISDIQASLDKLCNGLNRVGVETEALSQKMNKALNDVAQSDESLATKTTKAMQVLKSAMDEASKGIQVVPEMIDTANKRVETIEGTISKLNEQLAKTEKNSEVFTSITKQIDVQKQSLQLAKEDVTELYHSYENVKNSISEVNGAYQALNSFSVASSTLNSIQSTSNVAVGASATAAATATTAQAAAHTANAAAAIGNADAENQNAQATQQLTAALEEYISVSSGRVEIERMQSESIKELREDIKLYENGIKEIQNTIDSSNFAGKIEETTAKIEVQKTKIEQYKSALANLSKDDNASGNGAYYYNKLIDAAQQKIDKLQLKIENWEQEQQRLNADLQEYNTLLDAAKKIQAGENLSNGYKKATDEAKNTAKETKNIGKEAENATKKVGGIFSKFKNILNGALKGNFSALFSFFGKIGVWGAALGTIGKGLYELTIRAEEFRNALQPLSHYLNNDALNDVRQNIIALSGATAKSVSDMAAAATQFVKVWDSLRNSPEAITAMIKSSNEFGALAGKTSAEGAKFLSNLASEYHMTAQEATEASTMIATAARNSTSSFGEMADAISSAGSSAALYGVSFKEMATLIGFSSNQFGGAQKAASKFSMLLMSMSRMQDKYNPSIVGMITALQNLKEAYDRGEHVENNFMARQRSIALYFIKNADAIAKYNKGISDNTAKQNLLNDINARASVNVAKLQNAWNGFLTSINANLTPTLTKILKFFTRIIGGAQETARELDYIKNYDKIHPQAKENINSKHTSNPNSGVDPQQDIIDRKMARDKALKEGYEKYDKQEAFLSAKYRNQYKYFRNRYKNASEQAILNAANNNMVQYYEKNREKYTEFNSQTFNEWLRKKMSYTRSMNQKPINSNTNLGGNSYIPKTKKDKIAEQRKYREQLAEQQAKQLADDKKIEWELYVAEQENGIVKMHDGNEKELKQRKLDFEKKKHQIEDEAESLRQKNIQNAKADYDKNPANKKKEGFYASGLDKNVKLTTEQAQLIQTKLDTLNAEYEEENKKRLKEEISKWNAFVEKYGSIQQRIYAITEEYKRKIKDLRDSGNEIGVSAAENELQDKLSDLQMQQAKDAIDWDSVFQDLESHSSEYLEKLRTQLKNLLSSGTLKIDDMKVVSEQITKVDEAISKQKNSWGIVNESVREHKRLIEEAENAQLALNQAQSEQAKAGLANTSKKLDIQATLAAAGIDASYSSITYANKDKYISKVADPKTQSNLKKAFDELGATEVKLAKSTEEVTKAQKKANAANDKAKDSAEKTALEIVDGLQGVLDKVQDLPNLLSSIGLGNSGFAKSVNYGINGINSAKNAASDFATGNYIGAAFNSISAVKSFGKMFGIGGGNGAEVAKRTQELTESNQRLQYSIEQLKSSIDRSSGIKAVSNYQEAYKAQEMINKQSMGILQTQMGYHGSHHSNSYYWNLSDDAYAAINKTLAQQAKVKGKYVGASINSVNSLADLYKLTPEQMNDIRTYNQDVWKEMMDQGKYDKSEYWEQYAELAGKLEELTEQINQNLTQTSFDTMKNDFINNLTDMSKSAQDFADDFTAMLNKSMLNFALGKLMDEKLKPLYETWANKMKENGGRKLTPDEINELKKEYQKIIDEGMKERDTIAAITGYDEAQSRQTATSKAIEAITADQASALTGIGYAMQIALEQGNNTRNQISVDVSVMRNYAETTALNVSEMRDIQYEGLGQLQQIVKNTAPIILIREDIASMYKLMKDRY